MNIRQVKQFFNDKKETPCPLTERLIKAGYQQTGGGWQMSCAMRNKEKEELDEVVAAENFLNPEIDQQKTVLYRYKGPFQTLISGLKTGQITCWWGSINQVLTAYKKIFMKG